MTEQQRIFEAVVAIAGPTVYIVEEYTHIDRASRIISVHTSATSAHSAADGYRQDNADFPFYREYLVLSKPLTV